MGKFSKEETGIEGLVVISPTTFGDERGYFMETYNQNDFNEIGIDTVFVQDNQSCSKKGVIRGLHFQKNYPQSKLVRVVNGAVYDVAVDLRKGSPTYGKYYGVVLSAENKFVYFIPHNSNISFFELAPNKRLISLPFSITMKVGKPLILYLLTNCSHLSISIFTIFILLYSFEISSIVGSKVLHGLHQVA